MRRTSSLLSMAVVFVLFGAGTAQDAKAPANKEKIIGVWQFSQGTNFGKTLHSWEFTRDGQLKTVNVEFGKPGEAPKEVPVPQAQKYEVEGNNLKIDGVTWKILKLTDKELSIDNLEKDLAKVKSALFNKKSK